MTLEIMNSDLKLVHSGMKVAVVLCAHNPRPHHFAATLEGLKQQDFPLNEWELIIIDNASSLPLMEGWDLSWHPNGRIVVESELGLARARRRGYAESSGTLIVHSDDDNVLAANYLTEAWKIHENLPFIGSFGGQWIPQFDEAPKSDRELSFGGARVFKSAGWSNLPDDNRTMPFGAGMCLRREVMGEYLKQVEQDPRRLVLGRTGNRFITGEDIDLNYVATGIGLGTGLFPSLSLIHLMPKERINEQHMIRYAEGNAYSMVILHWLHFGEVKISRYSKIRALTYWLRIWLRMDSFARRIELAKIKGRREAIEDMRKWGWLD